MKSEIAIAVIAGLLCGSVMLAPSAAFKTSSGAKASARPAKSGIPALKSPPENALSFYQPIVDRDLFKPVAAEVPKPVIEKKLPIFKEVVITPPWQSPTQGFIYAGYASIDGVATAILQNAGTGEAAFLKQGDNFRGGKVEEITTTGVKLSFGTHSDFLPKSDEYNVVPLAAPGTNPAAPSANTGATPASSNSNIPVFRPTPMPYAPQSTPDAARLRQQADRLRAQWLTRRARLLEQLRSSPARRALPPIGTPVAPPSG